MNDVPLVPPREEDAAVRHAQQAQERGKPDRWRKRNVLGVLNWELALIVAVAVIAGIVATIGSSLVGVR